MRYALIIPDGAADHAQPALDGRTPLEAASIPAMDRLAREGCFGLARTVPDTHAPGSDVANMAVLGYDPAAYYTGRAPLEAASLGLNPRPDEAVFRANTVLIREGIMHDYAGGHIPTEASRPLIEELARRLDREDVRLYPGVSYRHICLVADMADAIPDRAPPHDILDRPVADHPPDGRHAERLLAIEAAFRALLPDLEANRRRAAKGHDAVTDLWLWGGGTMPSFPAFRDLFGVEGGLISAVDLLKGLALLTGLEAIDVPGATGYYDTNYRGKGEAALACLRRKPFVAIHVEAPDEAGHNGHAAEKVKAIEAIDRHVVAPLLAEADRAGDLRILCLPDHPTPLEVRTHTREPVPYALFGPGIPPVPGESFTEAAADRGAPPVPAVELMKRLTKQD